MQCNAARFLVETEFEQINPLDFDMIYDVATDHPQRRFQSSLPRIGQNLAFLLRLPAGGVTVRCSIHSFPRYSLYS